jgi:hypothetical protein
MAAQREIGIIFIDPRAGRKGMIEENQGRSPGQSIKTAVGAIPGQDLEPGQGGSQSGHHLL